jgi:hypothetical protein
LIVDRNFRTVLRNTERALILEKGRVAWGSVRCVDRVPTELAARLGV